MKPSTITVQRRYPSPAVTPQALAWDGRSLWFGSRDLRRIYSIDVESWKVIVEAEPPGIPWAAVSINGEFRFTIGESPDDDRYVYRYTPGTGFEKLFECPDLTGSYLSFDGNSLHLSQWYKGKILKLDLAGNILREIDVGAEICGHAFVEEMIYVLRGHEQPSEDWRIARLDPRAEKPEAIDLATVPFACRSLTFDGTNFWTNHRAANEIVSFSIPAAE